MTEHSTVPYLEPTQDAGRRFFTRGLKGPVVMLNMLRFRAVADYTAAPSLAPSVPISGAEAFERYIAHTLPFLHEAGGSLLFIGDGGDYLIGPPNERWDLVMLVRHRSPETFLSFASNEAYLGGLGHRLAAIEDSRLLPMIQHSV
jgi:uncharacterized protein (DUF1330 family)